MSDLGQRIEAAHTHAGLTQNQLEQRLIAAGYITGRGYLSRYRYGERGGTALSPHVLEAISDICGVDFHWLATGRGRMLPPMTPPTGRRPRESPLPPSQTGEREKLP